eukprot:CAMPEP_0183555776 /NCGR_PEP_ID=MMETSP0371-20130417/80494_1 /TAXON_ID=268820 /ORGANISM="Peridinium aciculiferum, Strain PAER-2" /LENGTH=34 /DNA_ID= /DNA_START= /DNA_END= /DNA_ORIENTATION=
MLIKTGCLAAGLGQPTQAVCKEPATPESASLRSG